MEMQHSPPLGIRVFKVTTSYNHHNTIIGTPINRYIAVTSAVGSGKQE